MSQTCVTVNLTSQRKIFFGQLFYEQSFELRTPRQCGALMLMVCPNMMSEFDAAVFVLCGVSVSASPLWVHPTDIDLHPRLFGHSLQHTLDVFIGRA